MDQLEGARVLLVDDSAHARRRLAKMLDAAGAEVTAVASSGDALAALGGASFDVLVCDLRLADGYSLMRSIRGGAVAGSVAIRSIAMMAHGVTETRQKALEAGFDDFVPKLVGALLVPAVARLREPTYTEKEQDCDALTAPSRADIVIERNREGRSHLPRHVRVRDRRRLVR